jgi:uncharacterized protein YukE
VTVPGEAGVEIALGDPGALYGASAQIQNVGGQLDLHGSTLNLTAASLAPGWQGEAALSYQQLSGISASHFQAAANQMLSASATLGQYATELERAQGEGTLALQQAVHWLDEIETEQAKLTLAQHAVTSAQEAITSAQGELFAAGHLGPAGAGLAAAAAAQLRSAQAALATAETDERNARRALDEAQQELTRWQRHGQHALDDAHAAAGRASRHLGTLSIVPPPLAGLPGITPLSPTPPPGLEDPARPGSLIVPAKKGKGGKGKGKGNGQPDSGQRAKPHKPSGTGKSGYDRHTKNRPGLRGKGRPRFRIRPKGHRGPWPPK